jgi:putative transposase
MPSSRPKAFQIVLAGVLVPRMNSITERWVRTCPHELLDRTLIWNRTHLCSTYSREVETYYDQHGHHGSKEPVHLLKAFTRTPRAPSKSN